MFKKMMMKQMLKSQMKGMPEADQKKAMEMVDKNPDLFEKIAKETKELVDGGLDKMSAATKVAQKYQDELKSASRNADSR